MGFEVKARILLELGAELISSDAIALYELIKNAIDAQSRKTEVDVVVTLKHSAYEKFAGLLDNPDAPPCDQVVEAIEDALEASASKETQKEFMSALSSARTRVQLRRALEDAYLQGNRISIRDNGHGMSLPELREVYLTVGTTSRLQQKRALFDSLTESDKDPAKIPLGEKGIGRLAAMRLGDVLEVATARKTDRHWNLLAVNWASIRHDLDQDLSRFPAEPKLGPTKEPAGESGTTISIAMVLADWTVDKLKGLARTEFSKLYDPFAIGVRRDDIRLRFNGDKVDPPSFERQLLDHADALCEGEFRYENEEPVLAGTVNYRLHKRTKTFQVTGEHLVSVLTEEPGKRRRPKRRPEEQRQLEIANEAVIEGLRTLGPFSFEFHWFNRGRLQRDEPDLWHGQLKDFVALWSGGLLVYRDGYRVYPYGSPEDDWLDLDRKALSASAYKLNRSQIIGRLRISSRRNPRLQDQTNREGFREAPEKQALVRLLRHVFITECRTFLEAVNDEHKPINEDDLASIERRLDESQKEAIQRVREIGRRIPEEKETVAQLLDHLNEVTRAWERTKEIAQNFEDDLEKYLHLAGVGLMVEFIAHELTRATQNALHTLESGKSDAKIIPATLDTLHAQLKTIEKRLRVLDPMSTPGRQRRVTQDTHPIVREVLEAHEAQFRRHGIDARIQVDNDALTVHRVEKGQIIQIFENFISNSVYWLREKRMRDPSFEPAIVVRFHRSGIIFRDNGPGIPGDRGEEVFNAFFTTKPPGKGRGLGLYIARKLAEYNDAKLALDPATKNGIHRGLILEFLEPK